MCGISGIYHFGNGKRVKENDVVTMRDTLIHRGPDDAGFYASPDKKVGLGTRRLKIIDLSPKGHMPMTSKQGKIWITYNGEIYNFMELKEDLKKKGYLFNSKGDTEVILNSYLEYGPNCVRRLNGMFAFVIWDETKKSLFAARDHMGVKPFYYALQSGTFYFGSEIKAILAHPDFKKELDEGNVPHYLTFSSLPAPHTLFKDIRKLPPAHYLVIQNGSVQEKEYWNPIRPTSPDIPSDEHFYIENIRYILRDSIKQQMVSDVPFGCFLSGGIDSSTNAALMTEALGKPVETFSVGSDTYDKYNEFQYSREMAKFIHTTPHEVLITEKHFEEFLPQYAYYADDPNGDQVCLPLFWLSKFTKESGVTVIQIGEGSDELFAGYNSYLLAKKLYESWWRWLEKFPVSFARGAYNISELIRNPKSDFGKEYIRRLARHQKPFWGNGIAFGDYHKEHLLTRGFKTRHTGWSGYPIVEKQYKELEGIDNHADFIKQLTYLEIKNRLPELLLARADRMTMAHSLEGRVPFLDTRLVELALNMPTNVKIKDNTAKYILKKSVEGIIPSKIIWREKQGFGTPMNEYLKPHHKISNRLIDIVIQSKLRERGILNYEYVDRLVGVHQKKGVDHNFRIWNLITLSLWYDYWFS